MQIKIKWCKKPHIFAEKCLYETVGSLWVRSQVSLFFIRYNGVTIYLFLPKIISPPDKISMKLYPWG